MAARLLVCVLLTVALLPTGPLKAQEWTRFRGPNGTGQSDTVLPAKFDSGNFRWKTELPGLGHSSPVIWGDRVFLLSANPDDATRHVICVNAKSGAILWTNTYPSATHKLHMYSSYASSTPVVDEDRVYVAWSKPDETTLMALDHDGRELWRKDLGTWTSQHGFGTSPIRYKNLLILFNSQQAAQLKEGQIPGESSMMAFEAETGDIVWQTERGSVQACYSVPFIYRGADGADQLVSCSTTEGVFSLDPNTGEPNWNLKTFRMRTVASPILAGGHIFGSTGSGGGGNYLVAVRPGLEATEAFRILKSAPYVPTPVASKDDKLVFLFGDGGVASCINPVTGETYWRERLSDAFFGSPIRAADKVYCIDAEGELFVVAADREFQLLGRTDLGEPSRSTPAVSDGRLFLRTFSHLICAGGPESGA